MGYIQPRGGRGGFFPSFQNNNRGKYSRRRQIQNTRRNRNRRPQNYTSQKQCYKCGKPFRPNHLQSCRARDKICTFAKVCRSDHVNFPQINTEDESRNENASQPHEIEVNYPVALADFTSRNGWEELQRDKYSMMSISFAFEIKQTVKISEEDLNGHILKLKTKSAEVLAIADSGSPMSFVNETTARRIHQSDKTTILKKIPPKDTAGNLACNKGKVIIPKGRLIVAIESGGWTIQSAPFIAVHDQKANILDPNLLSNIGIKLIQEKPQYKQVLSITEEDTSHPDIKQWVKENFANLCVKNWKSKKPCDEITSHPRRYTDSSEGSTYSKSPTRKSGKRTQQTNRTKTYHKVGNCSDKQFIHKNKYQTPNIDLLLDNIAQTVKSDTKD